MRILVPFDARTPKTRLSPVLGPTEREEFASVVLDDVLDVLRTAGHDPELLSTAPVDRELPVTVDQRPLTEAVNAALADATLPVAIVMADLALATVDSLDQLFAPDEDVVIAPGVGGGTNTLVVRHPEFRVDYHGASYRDHVEHAQASGASVEAVDSYRLALDVDDPGDLVEVLLHGEGDAATWLRAAGFELAESEERTIVTRSRESE